VQCARLVADCVKVSAKKEQQNESKRRRMAGEQKSKVKEKK